MKSEYTQEFRDRAVELTLCGDRSVPIVADQLGGYPDLDDWERHLTTLFPEARPRGFIEVRSLDAMPSPKRRAAVTVLTEALYNETRTEDLLDLFEGNRSGASDDYALRRSLLGILESGG